MAAQSYRIYDQGHCMSHQVRFNQREGSWQHLPPSGNTFHNVTRVDAAFVISNGGMIVPYRESSWFRSPSK